MNVSPFLQGDFTVTVTDVMGRRVLLRSYDAHTGNFTLDLSALDAGYYYITILNERHTITAPLVISR